MNSICLSTDHTVAALPVLGLDVAKASVQAELRTSGNKVRFGVDNNAKGFAQLARDRKSTRLNSSHVTTSYAVCCLKKNNSARRPPPGRYRGGSAGAPAPRRAPC